MKDSVSAIDLFCGAGGMTHGLIKAGIKVNAGIDIDQSCKYIFERNNLVRFYERDVNELDGKFINSLYPEDHIKVIVGCAPCQPFSTHNNKNKKIKKSKDGDLLRSFSRIIKEVKPEIVSMENVVQIKSKEVFDDFIANLIINDYHIFWDSIYCPDYGIPQTRRRLVLLASKLGEIKIIEKTHKNKEYLTVRGAIQKLEKIKGGERSKKDPLHIACELSELNKKRIRQSKPGGTWEDWDEELILSCHKKKSGKSYRAVYGRIEWDKPGPTITTQFYRLGTGRFGHPEQDRALSLREGAILQTFPRYYDFRDKNGNAYINKIGKYIGNAVPVKLAEVIGKSIMSHTRVMNNE